MISSGPLTVVDRDGRQATAETTLVAGGAVTALRLENGRAVIVPPGTLQKRDDGTYYLPLAFGELEPGGAAGQPSPSGTTAAHTEALVMPLIAEQMTVEKRFVETGGVRIRKVVREREETFDEPLVREQVQVERVPVGRPVDAPVPIRYEGETMIVPLVEEVLVVEKRLLLKEELHITRRQEMVHEPQTVTLRTEEAVIERFDRNEQEAPQQAARPSGVTDETRNVAVAADPRDLSPEREADEETVLAAPPYSAAASPAT